MTILTTLEALPRERPIYVYGSGAFGRAFLQALDWAGFRNVAAFVDSERSDSATLPPVLSLNQFIQARSPGGVLVICSQHRDEIVAALATRGIHDYFDASGFDLISRYRPDVEVVRFVHTYLRPGAVVLDVGSHTGHFTAMFAPRASHVHAFDVDPAIVPLFKRNTAGYPNVSFREAAVSNKAGKRTFYLDDPTTSHAANSLEVIESLRGKGSLRSIEVDAVTIDEFCAAEGVAPDFIKIDAEGHDPSVIEGAWKTIRTRRPVLVFEFPKLFWRERYRPLCRRLSEFYRLLKLESNGDPYWEEKRPTVPQQFLPNPMRGAAVDALAYYEKELEHLPHVDFVMPALVTNIGCIPK